MMCPAKRPTVNELLDHLMRGNIAHFAPAELWDPEKSVPSLNTLWRVMPTLEVADDLRSELGVPLIVWSGYRGPQHNRRVGGAPMSLHLEFNALDLHPLSDEEDAVERLHQAALNHHMAPLMGIGRYERFVHIDTRGVLGRRAPARWDQT